MPSTTKYRYSFSGADCKVFAYFPQAPSLMEPLESVHTLSVSVHEAKGQARALGHRGIKGLARGVRTIAGSIIMTVVNDHPLRSLQQQYIKAFVGSEGDDPIAKEPSLGWSLDRHMTGVGSLHGNYDYYNRLAVLLPPFNIALQYVSEVGDALVGSNVLEDPEESWSQLHPENAGSMIVGVEFVDEGQVTSVQDIVTEITFSFIAHDYKPLSYHDIYGTGIGGPVVRGYTEALQKNNQVLEALHFDADSTRGSSVMRLGAIVGDS